MRRPADSRLQVMEFEALEITAGAADGQPRKLYAVEGVPGIFRRVPKSTLPEGKLPAGVFAGYFGAVKVYLEPARAVLGELRQAGIVPLPVRTDTATQAARRQLLDDLFASSHDDDKDEGPQAEEAEDEAGESPEEPEEVAEE